jgi:hypothetical protein
VICLLLQRGIQGGHAYGVLAVSSQAQRRACCRSCPSCPSRTTSLPQAHVRLLPRGKSAV